MAALPATAAAWSVNVVVVQRALARQLASVTDLAQRLGVPGPTLREWLQGQPPPAAMLMRMAQLLEVPLRDLTGAGTPAPAAAGAWGDDHWTDALEFLTEFLSVDPLYGPASLRARPLQYEQWQAVAAGLRQQVGVPRTGPLQQEALARLLRQAEVVVLPQFQTEPADAAVRLVLPGQATTFVRLNLRMSVEWARHLLAHEVAQALCRGNFDDTVRDPFCTELAVALLFPEAVVHGFYQEAMTQERSRRVSLLHSYAHNYGVAPQLIAGELERYARTYDLPEPPMPQEDVAAANFALGLVRCGEHWFGGEPPMPGQLVGAAERTLGTPAFAALRRMCLNRPDLRAAYLERLLEYPTSYCEALLAELRRDQVEVAPAAADAPRHSL